MVRFFETGVNYLVVGKIALEELRATLVELRDRVRL